MAFKFNRYLNIFLLILVGEMIFALPFHITRFFRPTFMEALNLTNTDLGDAFAVYGITAMICYFPGGFIADRVPEKKLIVGSLISTAAGGFYLSTLPGPLELSILYGFWGVTTILFFWAALIKATKLWGGVDSQGKAFGFLEGGRGLAAALFTSVIFYFFFPSQETDLLDASSRQSIIQQISIFYAVCLLTIAMLFNYFYKTNDTKKTKKPLQRKAIKNFKPILTYKVWLLSGVVLCAYCGYKSLDNIGLFLQTGWGWSEVDAAGFSAILAYLRPITAVLAGVTVDLISPSKSIKMLFLLLCISSALLSSFSPTHTLLWFLIANIGLSFFVIYALRSIYFSLIAPCNFPKEQVGTVIGIISVIGFTPDIFFAPITGRILDNNPGLIGHQNYYLAIFSIALLGLLCSIKLNNILKV
ncbi:MAG: hypothetical protein CBC42_00860 [Betaproteobacteria bacterium TMED82]|nr:MAG: hypothetical protein CBC42_00860 [Betaproteobacteria bacterium TMED82]|tara:strand:- start:17560 stop:18804 length:1245 start_codon:yes stop_codon:yes gene_type:complete